MNIQEGLTPSHLKKAKLMFFYTRYPSSNVLKTFFPDVKVISLHFFFTRSTTRRIVCPVFNSPASTCQCVFGTEKSAVCRRRETKNAEGLNSKAAELLVCPGGGGRGRYGGILSLKKSHSSQQME